MIVADSVGLGKTWIGKKLLEDYAYHLRQKALVICPASLKPMWENELRSASISTYVVTQVRLAVDDFDIREVADVDVIPWTKPTIFVIDAPRRVSDRGTGILPRTGQQ